MADDATDLLPAGTILGDRYRLDAVLGEGAFSVVYAGTQLTLERPVAIKLMRVSRLSAHAHARFMRESQAVSRMAHPNILQVHDFGIDEASARAYLVLERVAGMTLLARLREVGPADEGTAARWMSQVARALAHAHSRGILHRDLKPANLMVTDDEDGSGLRVKVLDFGLAKLLNDDTQAPLTTPGRPLGTLSFASPEQILGLPADERSDLFGLGCVLYATLVGRSPWGPASSADQVRARLHADPPPLPSELCDGRAPSVALTRIVRQLMARDPNDRPADATSVADALDAIASDRLKASLSRPTVETDPVLLSPQRPTVEQATAIAHPAVGAELTAVVESPTKTIDRTTPLAASPITVEANRAPPIAAGLMLAVIAALVALAWPSITGRSEVPPPSTPPLASPPTSAAPALVEIGAIPAAPPRLSITTIPEGASVEHEGRELGLTPLSFDVTALPASLVLRKPGYREHALTASSTAAIEVALVRAEAPKPASSKSARPTPQPSKEPYRFW